MNWDAHLLILTGVFAMVSLAGAAHQGLLPLGLLFIVLFVAALVAVQRTILPVTSLLFAGEPLGLLGGPGTPLLLLTHLLLLGIVLQRSGSLDRRVGWGAFLATALLAFPCILLMPALSPLLAVLLPIILAGGVGAGAVLSLVRIQGLSGGAGG